MKILNSKCQNCSGKSLITHTFNNIARLDPKDYYWGCMAGIETECLDGEPMNSPCSES